MQSVVKRHYLTILITALVVLAAIITIGRLTLARASKTPHNPARNVQEQVMRKDESPGTAELPKTTSSLIENTSQTNSTTQPPTITGGSTNNVVVNTSNTTGDFNKTLVTGHVYNNATSNACGRGIIGESCNLPVSAYVQIRRLSGEMVAIVRANDQGIFTTELEPGEYQFIPQHKEDINPDAPARTVTVGTTPIDLTIIYEAIATTNALNF